MSKIQVITDSSADITEKEAEVLGLKVVRMPIALDGVEYTEGIDIDCATFIQKMREGAVAKTSQATLGWVKRIWDEALKERLGNIFGEENVKFVTKPIENR